VSAACTVAGLSVGVAGVFDALAAAVFVAPVFDAPVFVAFAAVVFVAAVFVAFAAVFESFGVAVLAAALFDAFAATAAFAVPDDVAAAAATAGSIDGSVVAEFADALFVEATAVRTARSLSLLKPIIAKATPAAPAITHTSAPIFHDARDLDGVLVFAFFTFTGGAGFTTGSGGGGSQFTVPRGHRLRSESSLGWNRRSSLGSVSSRRVDVWRIKSMTAFRPVFIAPGG
jgi:hypothetical protein